MDAKQLVEILNKRRQKMTREEWDALRPKVAGANDLPFDENGKHYAWDPNEKAVTKGIHPPEVEQTSNWATATLRAAALGSKVVILGAGESALRHDLSALNSVPTIGVNWTRKWFEPTYLHILDKQPFRKQVIENQEHSPQTAQVITCRTTLDHAVTLGYAPENTLAYEVKDDSCGKHHAFTLASGLEQPFQSFPNSLGYALQAAVVLGFTKIALVGFDFGGYHFFGDGRKEGCFPHYGEIGDAKQYLIPMLLAQAHIYEQTGIRVRQLPPTSLRYAYRISKTLEEALAD